MGTSVCRRGLAHSGSPWTRCIGHRTLWGTSVPGIKAKPIIDLQIGVADIREGLGFIEPMAGLGYEYAGDQGIPEHHIFGRGVARTHLAHVVVFDGDQWRKSLYFRDRLRTDPDVRKAYEALKAELAAATNSRADYTAAKTDFIAKFSMP